MAYIIIEKVFIEYETDNKIKTIKEYILLDGNKEIFKGDILETKAFLCRQWHKQFNVYNEELVFNNTDIFPACFGAKTIKGAV